MGSDDLHHKRRAKAARDVARRKAQKKRYDKVLIVSEGSKTEPNYFEEIKLHYEIDTANIRISGECGSAPMSVVDHGIELYDEEVKKGLEPYDRVYCVFDRDAHSCFDAAVQKIKTLSPKDVFYSITSVPCFEVWILLHFRFSSAPFMATGSKSSGAKVLDELLEYWPDYKKGQADAFERTFNDLDMAIHSADRLNREAQVRGGDNPSTNVHELVRYLRDIKSTDIG